MRWPRIGRRRALPPTADFRAPLRVVTDQMLTCPACRYEGTPNVISAAGGHIFYDCPSCHREFSITVAGFEQFLAGRQELLRQKSGLRPIHRNAWYRNDWPER